MSGVSREPTGSHDRAAQQVSPPVSDPLNKPPGITESKNFVDFNKREYFDSSMTPQLRFPAPQMEMRLPDEMELDITDCEMQSASPASPEPAKSWGGQIINQCDIFNQRPAIPENEAGMYDQYEHFAKPFTQDKNRARMSRARNTTTIYKRTLPNFFPRNTAC